MIRAFKGPEAQTFHHKYLQKEKYFEQQCRIKVAWNNVLNNLLH